MDKSVYCTVRWSNHSNNVNRFLSVSYAEEKYTDVALACDGHLLKAHKIILAGCSPHFENLFSMYSVPNLCVTVEGIAYPILQLVLEFMYSGEIRVKHSELESLVKAGVQLKVKGLDAIKLNDLTRGAERTAVIARPTDGNQKPPKSVRPASFVAPVALKAPSKPDAPTSNVQKIHLKKVDTPPFEKLMRAKPANTFNQPPNATSTPLPKFKQEPVKTSQEPQKSSAIPVKSKNAVENAKTDGEPRDTMSSKPVSVTSESKKKVGQWLDSLEKAETEEVLPKVQKKRAAKPRASRSTTQEPRASRSTAGEVAKPQEEEKNEAPESADKLPLAPQESNNAESEQGKIDVDLLKLKEEKVSNEGDQEDEKELIPSPSKKLEVFDRSEPTTSTRSRTIKKPARLVDVDFEFEQEMVQPKKRRARKAVDDEENEGKGSPTKPDETSPSKQRLRRNAPRNPPKIRRLQEKPRQGDQKEANDVKPTQQE